MHYTKKTIGYRGKIHQQGCLLNSFNNKNSKKLEQINNDICIWQSITDIKNHVKENVIMWGKLRCVNDKEILSKMICTTFMYVYNIVPMLFLKIL